MGGDPGRNRGTPGLLLGFLAGIAGGIWGYFGGGLGEKVALTGICQGYFQVLAQGGGQVKFWPLFFDLVRWPLSAWLMGWMGAGYYCLPLIFAARGFLLALSVLILANAGMGNLMCFLTVGVSAALSIPALFLMGRESSRQTKGLGLKNLISWHEVSKRFWLFTLLALLWLGLCAVAEMWLLPPLMRLAVFWKMGSGS